MGGRQSKRSVDITTTPKKEGIPAEGGVVGDAAAPGDGKLERIEETDTKPTTNGIAPHTDVAEDKDKDKDDTAEKEKEEKQTEEVKAEDSKAETKVEGSGESPTEAAEVTTPTEATATSPSTATSPDSKEAKKKDKPKKKWSFRSISFSKKDKTKPAREETPKNGDVTKEEPLAEGGEEAETASATAASPAEDKSAVSSPSGTEQETTPAEGASEGKDEGAATPAASSPADEKKEEPTPSAPTPVPVEEKKEEVEKVDAEKKVVEVSGAAGGQIVDPVQVCRVQPVATLSIIERKTSEEIPSLPPSSPPPTPIDPSPFQQAQQAQATAQALAEALKLPVENVPEETTPVPQVVTASNLSSDRSRDQTCKPPAESCSVPPASSIDEPPAQAASAPAKVEALPVVDQEQDEPSSSSSKCDQNPLPVLETAAESTGLVASEKSPSLSETNATEQIQVDVSQPVSECRVESRAEGEIVEEERRKEVRKLEAGVEMECKVEEKVESVEKPEEVEASAPASTYVTEAPSEESKPELASEAIDEEVRIVETVVEEVETGTPDGEVVLPDSVEEAIEEIIEPLGCPVREGVEDVTFAETEVVIEPVESKTDLVIETEEGPVPLLEEDILVEAKPAVVIAEEETEEVLGDANTKIDEPVEVVELVDEEDVEPPVATSPAEPVVLEEAEDTSVPNVPSSESVQLIEETIVIVENPTSGEKDVIEIVEVDELLPPPPPPPQESPVPNAEQANEETATVPSPPLETSEITAKPSVEKEESHIVEEALPEPPIPPAPMPEANLVTESPTHCSSSRLEDTSVSSDDLPSAPTEPVECLDSGSHSLPPEELSCPLTSKVPEHKNALPVADEGACQKRNATETVLTPPSSPSPQSNVSITSNATTPAKDSSEKECTRESKSPMSPKSCSESEIELKERLAESEAKVEKEEESISCQLSNSTTTTASQEIHQSTPEVEPPVENNVAHEVSTTESVDEAPKIAPPAVPIDIPASPPSAPAITEDVASVTKAIEEIDINDKAVAAAAMECNTVEIIADATHQKNINE